MDIDGAGIFAKFLKRKKFLDAAIKRRTEKRRAKNKRTRKAQQAARRRA